MKLAQEIRSGNVVMINNEPMVILKADYNKSGRNAAVMKLKYKNLLTGSPAEGVFKADDKFDVVMLDRKECSYSYFADPMYVFMDADFNQYEVEQENIGDTLNYIVDGMEDTCEVTFYDGRAISVELPTTIVREVTYAESVVRGNTSGKVMKPAKLSNGHEIQVADFIEQGDKIEIDTRTGEFKRRAN